MAGGEGAKQERALVSVEGVDRVGIAAGGVQEVGVLEHEPDDDSTAVWFGLVLRPRG